MSGSQCVMYYLTTLRCTRYRPETGDGGAALELSGAASGLPSARQLWCVVIAGQVVESGGCRGRTNRSRKLCEIASGPASMKPPLFEYHCVESVAEAVGLLAEHGDEAKVLAGGQSLIPLLAIRLSRPAHIVDINRLRELASIDAHSERGVAVGATVRQRVAERSPDVARLCPLLVSALQQIGHGAIRNRGTIAGSIAHADPAAELPTVLVALDGEVEVASSRGTRVVRAVDLFDGFLTTSLDSDELITCVRFPHLEPGSGWSFQEFSRRSGDFAVAGVAAVIRLTPDGRIRAARMAISGVDSKPVRALEGETNLLGSAPVESLFAEVASAVSSRLSPAADSHGGPAYRRHLTATLIRRALREACDRAEFAR